MAPTARACASCGCGDPTLTAFGLEKPYRNRLRLSLEERLGTRSQGNWPADHETVVLRSSLSVAWSALDRLTLGANVPVVSQWLRNDRASSWAHATGLGDAEVVARIVALRDRAFSPRHLATVTTGLKLPSGPRIQGQDGYPLPEDNQPGSGSFDPSIGAGYAYFGEAFTAFGTGSYRHTTEGRHGYRRGAQVVATAGVQVQPRTEVAFGLSTDLSWSDADSQPSTDPQAVAARTTVADTGGLLWAITPSVLLAPREGWIVRLAVQLHVGDQLAGSQRESHTALLSTAVDLN